MFFRIFAKTPYFFMPPTAYCTQNSPRRRVPKVPGARLRGLLILLE